MSADASRPFAVLPHSSVLHYAHCEHLWAKDTAADRDDVRPLTQAQAVYWLGRYKNRRTCRTCQPPNRLKLLRLVRADE